MNAEQGAKVMAWSVVAVVVFFVVGTLLLLAIAGLIGLERWLF